MKVTETKLDQIVSNARHGIIDLDHRQKWEEFKNEWSKEDLCLWKDLMTRLVIGSDGKLSIYPPLSNDETAWVKGLVDRAEQKGLA